MKEIVKNAMMTMLMGALLLPIPILYNDAGHIDGRAFPVVTDTTIETMTPVPGGVEIDLSFSKVRRCKYMDMQWYVETFPNVWREIAVVFPEDNGGKPRTRPTGRFSANWTLLMPQKFIGQRLKQELLHSCWGPMFWLTVTTEMPLIPPKPQEPSP